MQSHKSLETYAHQHGRLAGASISGVRTASNLLETDRFNAIAVDSWVWYRGWCLRIRSQSSDAGSRLLPGG